MKRSNRRPHAARTLTAAVGALAGFAVQAQTPTPATTTPYSAEHCLQPVAMTIAARCELRQCYCAKPPNEAWRTR